MLRVETQCIYADFLVSVCSFNADARIAGIGNSDADTGSCFLVLDCLLNTDAADAKKILFINDEVKQLLQIVGRQFPF
jgi:hypothetical protein